MTTVQPMSTGSRMGTKIAIVAVLAVAVAGVLYAKRPTPSEKTATPANAVAESAGATPPSVPTQSALPRMVDLGADKCIPCKMMMPILDELKEEYAGRLDVQFIDVWKNPEAGEEYGVEVIPTQIFYDAAGKELFRHQGFFSKEDILAKWKGFGVDLGSADPSAGG